MSECILWPGGRMAGGYGAGPRGVLAHRYAYERSVGPIPEGFIVHHICETLACVNPAHLQAMSRGDHIRLHENPRKTWEDRRAATHCKHGHQFDEANTHWQTNGRRRCRTCDRLRHRRLKAEATP